MSLRLINTSNTSANSTNIILSNMIAAALFNLKNIAEASRILDRAKIQHSYILAKNSAIMFVRKEEDIPSSILLFVAKFDKEFTQIGISKDEEALLVA